SKKGRRTSLPFLALYGGAKKLLHCRDARSQTGFVSRGGVFVQRALLDGLVESRDGRAVCLLGGSFVALGDDLAQVTQLGAQRGGVGAIARRTAFGLAGALQRRKMICHV